MKEELKLHEAIVMVLKGSHKESMTPQEIADEINKNALYERGDQGLVPPSQISARVNNYPKLFNKQTINGRSYISLKS